MEQRLIDANLIPLDVEYDDIKNAPTVEAIAKKDLQKATNKIIKCSLGKWYVGRTDGKSEEVVLLEEVLNILTDLLNKG